jgi:mono/diheme cytochrome c family protein
MRIPAGLVGALLLTGLSPGFAAGQETADFFRQNCSSCHTIGGGRLTGPDLKDVTKRKDLDWLAQFIVNPKAVIDGGDPYAGELVKEARGQIMPTIFGMTRERAESLLKLIEAESLLEKSQFIGLQISDKPFTPADLARGKEYFQGTRPFTNGAAACLSCHSLHDAGLLGGGRLGPDLTRAYERLQGRKGLAAWLMAPATSTMQPIFKAHPLQPDEILPLVAYLEESAKLGGEESAVAPLNFFLLGLGGTVVGLVVFDALWKKRFRAVRRPLVHGQARGAS